MDENWLDDEPELMRDERLRIEASMPIYRVRGPGAR